MLKNHSRKIVVGGFMPSNEADIAIAVKKKLCRPQPAVEVIAVAIAIGTCVMKHQQVACGYLGEKPVSCEAVPVLAKRSGNFIALNRLCRFLSHDSDMMVVVVS